MPLNSLLSIMPFQAMLVNSYPFDLAHFVILISMSATPLQHDFLELPLAQLAPGDYLDAALEVITVLQAAGYEACFVGGAVRNALFGLKLKDIDIATSATPEQVALLFHE